MCEPSAASRLQRPVFIIGCHKSGSSFLRALLDGHPGLGVIPGEAHFFHVLGRGVQYPLMQRPPAPLSMDDVRDRLVHAAGVFSANTDPYSDAPGFRGYDMEEVSRRASSLTSTAPSYLLKEYLQLLYEASHGQEPQERRVVEKSVENAEFIPTLDGLTDGARFVAIVRNPYANLVAVRRHRALARGRYPMLRPLVESLRCFHYALLRARIHQRNLLVIRYEDLVLDTRAVMGDVIEFLDEPWDDALLTPSSLGQQEWVSNSTWGTDAAISHRSLRAWEGDLRPLEVAAVELHLAGICEEYGYEQMASPSLLRLLLPTRREPPPTWVVNRLDVAGEMTRRSRKGGARP